MKDVCDSPHDEPEVLSFNCPKHCTTSIDLTRSDFNIEEDGQLQILKNDEKYQVSTKISVIFPLILYNYINALSWTNFVYFNIYFLDYQCGKLLHCLSLCRKIRKFKKMGNQSKNLFMP